jgi:very-short-patch-repair endonuclease
VRAVALRWTRLKMDSRQPFTEGSATPHSKRGFRPSDPVEAEGHARVLASLENWKRKLLDLTKRNRALNFRMNKVSTIAIVDEQPAEVFRRLYLREMAMRFRPAPEPQETQGVPVPRTGQGVSSAPATVSSPGAAQLDSNPDRVEAEQAEAEFDDENDEDGSLQLDFVAYDPTALDERYSDEWLQTASRAEALDKSLRRLDEQARLSIEEQGVNTLFLALGMLHYTESADSEQVFRAPLVLLPVELTRKTARSGYQIRVSGEDPIVNPALAQYLSGFGITLPTLPDTTAMAEDYDLQSLLSTTSELIHRKKDWGLKTDIYLGLFSFQKFVMYKDLEANGEQFAGHRMIRNLVLSSGGHIVGLPDDIRAMQLDKEYPPESTFQVVDADSSQLRTIAACARNHDIVIEGPPGTGKSQTITNLIAQALASDKSVLFVAEKMAALEVVHSRLVQAGLGESCLELHSTKANKRTVMKELGIALDATLQGIAAPTASTQRLPHVRTTLSEYAAAVHTPYGILRLSPYRAYGELGRVIASPRLTYSGALETVTLEQLDGTVRDLQDLAAASAPIGAPREHPWRDANKTFYSEDDIASVQELSQGVLASLSDLTRQAQSVQQAYHLPEILTFADIEMAAAIGSALKRSPGPPIAVLRDHSWDAAEAQALVGRGREVENLKERVRKWFTPDVLGLDHSQDISYIEQRLRSIFSFLAFLDGRYRSIKKRWLGYRLGGFRGTLAERANEMKCVDRLRVERAAIARLEPRARELFGALWKGEHSSWQALDGYIGWVGEFRDLCSCYRLDPQVSELASAGAVDVGDIGHLEEMSKTGLAYLVNLRLAVGWPSDYLARATLTEVITRVESILESARRGPQWAAFEAARQTASRGLAGELIPEAIAGKVQFRDLAPAFLRAFYMKWLSLVVQERAPLAKFHTLTHEERVAEFRRLDERVLLENRAALVSQLRDRVQHRLQQADISASLPHLRRQLARQRGHAPLRRTIRQAGDAIRAIKPCFMMSPLTVAQLLDGSAQPFDVVIFDEASQLPPEDAVGAIARGKQLVVVGDPKQLPPTNFFLVTSGQVTAPRSEDGTPMYEDTESVLENCMGAGLVNSRLKWHYRSTHQSLINFSNVSFYDSDLYVFPSIETGTERYGLQFEHVADGVYEGKGVNHVEARRVVDAVVRFAKEQAGLNERGEPAQTLGVGTFNLRQQIAIQDELEQRRREDPGIEPFFARGTKEPFFVKNLENIQGDERDVIFISVTYARAADGKLRYNFGPLNAENGWRRLNVLVTRARRCMRVFSSMRGDEINAAATTSTGARLLREFLVYAEHGRLDSAIASITADTESLLERDVLTELTRRGLTVVPQVGVAGYRIDLGVLDDEAPGRFLCGIECDGVAYHSSETARDRDRLRQQVLEARGWTIHRVWSTDWFKDRHGQIERLIALIEETRERTREEERTDREARHRAAAGAADPVAQTSEAIDEAIPGFQAPAETKEPYERPGAAPYVTTPGQGWYTRLDLFLTPHDEIVSAAVQVVETESPIHRTDVLTRVAGFWGLRLGSRIQATIVSACNSAERRGLMQRRGDFYWSVSSGGKCTFRSRAATGIAGDRIAPEEYEQVILAVLAKGHSFPRGQLANEVRGVLGFGRTGAVLEATINSAIDALLSQGKLGEGSYGIRLRM